MATTNFANLPIRPLTIWKRQLWRQARNQSFVTNFLGSDSNSMITRVTELSGGNKVGNRAIVTLVADLVGDGVAGDRTLEGNEEPMKSYEEEIRYDMLRTAIRHEGRMADKKSVVNFRTNARNNGAYWLAERIDQLAFLTLSGVSYAFNTDGSARVGSDLPYLEFANDVTAPSTNRHFRWVSASDSLAAGNTAAVTAADTPSWKMLIQAKAEARNRYIKPVRVADGVEVYHVFMNPTGMAKLKLDPDYIANIRQAYNRGTNNPLFSGTTSVMADGLIIHEYRHVFNTGQAISGAVGNAGAAGYKWGANADVNGQRVLMCGAQALGFCDLGTPDWNEEWFDYKNKGGISVGKIFGFLKPQWYSPVTGDDQDFGVLSIDKAI